MTRSIMMRFAFLVLLAALPLSAQYPTQAGPSTAVTYGTTSGTAAAGNDSRFTNGGHGCPVENATNICITSYGAVGDGTTDNSTAFRNAITALATTGGTIWVPNGVYAVNGALQDATGANAVLPMPRVANGGNPLLAIAIKGYRRPDWGTGRLGAVITTTATTGNFIGGYDSDAGAGIPGFTNVKLELENLTFVGPDNPGLTMIDASHLQAYDQKHLLIITTTNTLGANTAGVAVKFPTLANQVQNFSDDTQTAGYYTGYILTEHTRVGSIFASGGHDCFKFDTGLSPGTASVPATYTGNSVSIQYLWEQTCTNAISGGANPTVLNIQTADLELPGTYGINDPSNNLRGTVNVLNPYSSGSGQCSTPVNGATNLKINYLWCAASAAASANTIVNNPASSQTINNSASGFLTVQGAGTGQVLSATYTGTASNGVVIRTYAQNLAAGNDVCNSMSFGAGAAHAAAFHCLFNTTVPYYSLQTYASGDPIQFGGTQFVFQGGPALFGNTSTLGAAAITTPTGAVAAFGTSNQAYFSSTGALTVPSCTGCGTGGGSPAYGTPTLGTPNASLGTGGTISFFAPTSKAKNDHQFSLSITTGSSGAVANSDFAVLSFGSPSVMNIDGSHYASCTAMGLNGPSQAVLLSVAGQPSGANLQFGGTPAASTTYLFDVICHPASGLY